MTVLINSAMLSALIHGTIEVYLPHQIYSCTLISMTTSLSIANNCYVDKPPLLAIVNMKVYINQFSKGASSDHQHHICSMSSILDLYSLAETYDHIYL